MPGFLMSFHYFRKQNMEKVMRESFGEPPYPPLFADSGAYSAWSLGQPIKVEEYADWLDQWGHLFNVVSNLDVKGDVAAGLRNQAYLERRGHRVCPVFHGGEPWSVLEDFCQHYPYILLGGLAGASVTNGDKRVLAWLTRCFQIAGKRSVFHGFGMTNWQNLKLFPWYSVDSSSWGQGFRFGAVPLFLPDRGAWTKLSIGDHQGVHQHAALIRRYGVDPERISDRKLYHHHYAAMLAGASYGAAELWLRKRHGEQHCPDPRFPVGLNLYLADSTIPHFHYAQKGITQYLAAGNPSATGKAQIGMAYQGVNTSQAVS